MRASVYAPILKKERQSDGTLLVTGIATDDTLDVDDQICDPAWLERAMPAWFEYGNIREQHSNIAAGVAMKLEQDGSRHIVTARVVDPTSVMKVESGVLKGFSIGIRDPRIAKDKAAPGGRIVDGEIVEVSLVDRPANPSCMLELAKSVGGSVRQVETLIVKGESVDRCEECGKGYPSEDMDGKMCKECKAAAEVTVGDETTGEEDGVAMADEESTEMKEESSQAVGEVSEGAMGEESSQAGNVGGVAGRADEGSMEHVDEEMSLLGAITERLARIEAMLAEFGKAKTDATEETAKSVKALDERLAKVEKSASRGPVRTLVKAVAVDDSAVTAAKTAEAYRVKAMQTNDPALAEGYLMLAAQLQTTN